MSIRDSSVSTASVEVDSQERSGWCDAVLRWGVGDWYEVKRARFDTIGRLVGANYPPASAHTTGNTEEKGPSEAGVVHDTRLQEFEMGLGEWFPGLIPGAAECIGGLATTGAQGNKLAAVDSWPPNYRGHWGGLSLPDTRKAWALADRHPRSSPRSQRGMR